MIKKGIQVEVICGKDKGKKGEVIEILRNVNKAKVKGINIIKKHEKTTKEKKGGIISKESFIHISNLKNLDKTDGDKIKGIADGNGEVSQLLNVAIDKSANYMGFRSKRFAMIIDNNVICNTYVEKSGKLEVSSAESILLKL